MPQCHRVTQGRGLNHKAWKNAESALPATSGTLKVEGLQNPVTAFRDAWGVQTGFPCQNYPHQFNSIQKKASSSPSTSA